MNELGRSAVYYPVSTIYRPTTAASCYFCAPTLLRKPNIIITVYSSVADSKRDFQNYSSDTPNRSTITCRRTEIGIHINFSVKTVART